jgi:hypothetical protein
VKLGCVDRLDRRRRLIIFIFFNVSRRLIRIFNLFDGYGCSAAQLTPLLMPHVLPFSKSHANKTEVTFRLTFSLRSPIEIVRYDLRTYEKRHGIQNEKGRMFVAILRLTHLWENVKWHPFLQSKRVPKERFSVTNIKFLEKKRNKYLFITVM